MSRQGTLSLDTADDHSSPFARDESDDRDESDSEREGRSGTTLADYGTAGQATIEGFGGE